MAWVTGINVPSLPTHLRFTSEGGCWCEDKLDSRHLLSRGQQQSGGVPGPRLFALFSPVSLPLRAPKPGQETAAAATDPSPYFKQPGPIPKSCPRF